jgi:alkylhydroperoxidase/carboxymuconolactone decarboxylase family protein YurZ
MIPAELTDPKTGGYRLPWHDVFRQYDPEQFEAYRTWQASLVNHKELDRKTHELIVIAIDALVAWPSPFIDVHIHGAFDAGATIQEVLESILVAAQFGGGHALNHGLTAMAKTIAERSAAGAPTPHRGNGAGV